MPSKRERLLARAKATTRQPSPVRLLPRRDKPGYRVVTISLYSDQANWLDDQAQQRRVKRSTLVQQLIERARLGDL